jgi:hypothetical protein
MDLEGHENPQASCFEYYYYYYTLSFGRMSGWAKGRVNSSAQAMRMRSGVAGESSTNHPVWPASFRAAEMAALMAKRAEAARNRGGSPTAFEE